MKHQAIEYLKNLLEDSDPKAKMHAAKMLGYLGDNSGYRVAVEGLQAKSKYERDVAAAALGHIGRKEALPSIRETIEKMEINRNVGEEAILSIEVKQLNSQSEKLEFLKNVVETSNGDRREVAAWIIASMDEDPNAMNVLKQIATNPKSPGYETANRIARRIGLKLE